MHHRHRRTGWDRSDADIDAPAHTTIDLLAEATEAVKVITTNAAVPANLQTNGTVSFEIKTIACE